MVNSNSVAWKKSEGTPFLIKQQRGGKVEEGREGCSPSFPPRHIITLSCHNQKDCPEKGCSHKKEEEKLQCTLGDEDTSMPNRGVAQTRLSLSAPQESSSSFSLQYLSRQHSLFTPLATNHLTDHNGCWHPFAQQSSGSRSRRAERDNTSPESWRGQGSGPESVLQKGFAVFFQTTYFKCIERTNLKKKMLWWIIS